MVGGPEADAKTVVRPKTVLISTIKTLPDYLNHDVLHHKYVVEKLSVKQIAKEISSSKTSVIDGLKRFKIPTRPIGNSSDCPTNPPYGKRYKNGAFVEHRAESRVIKSIIVPRFLRGDTLTSTVQFLDSQKIPTKKGGLKWHTEMLRQILLREGIYKSKRKPRGKSSSISHRSKQKNVKRKK